MDISINSIFTIQKGNRKSKWKIVPNPWFPGAFGLVGEYNGIKSGIPTKEDYDYICHSTITFEKAIESAYNNT